MKPKPKRAAEEQIAEVTERFAEDIRELACKLAMESLRSLWPTTEKPPTMRRRGAKRRRKVAK